MQRLFRDSSASAMHLPNPEQFLHEHRRMLYQPVNQPQQFMYQKSQPTNGNYPAASIKRSSNGDVYSYINQMARNNLKPSNNLDATTYHLVETPFSNGVQDLVSLPSSVQANHLRKENPVKKDNSNSNLQASASSGHVAFAVPPTHSNEKKINSQSNLNPNNSNNSNNLKINSLANQSNGNQANSHSNVQQTSPVYRPIDDENKSNEKVSLDQYAIKEQAFDQKQLVHSQLSQIVFKTSPELAKLEESLKRSAV